MTAVVPILRIFDYDKAVEFYINWLEFKVDWQHKPEDSPLYMQISKGDVVLNLSEHHGDASPGSTVRIVEFDGLIDYHRLLLKKKYKYNHPGIETPFWDANVREVCVNDPFGNRLIFSQTVTRS